jgi:hypothetical protein
MRKSAHDDYDPYEGFGFIAWICVMVTLIIFLAVIYNAFFITSEEELNEKLEQKMSELHNHPYHPLTVPIDSITDEEFKLFQEINGLSLDSDKEGSIVDVDGKPIE